MSAVVKSWTLFVEAWDTKQETVFGEPTAATPLAIMFLGEQAWNTAIHKTAPRAIVIIPGAAKLKLVAMDDCAPGEWILGTLPRVCVALNMAIGHGNLRT